MTLSLNTSDPLYAHLISAIAIEAGALVDLKSAKTFTPHANSSFGTGTYGAHFQTSAAGGYTPYGASFTPAVAVNATANGNSVLLVVNGTTGPGGGNQIALGNTTANNYMLNAGWGTNNAGVSVGYATPTFGSTDVTSNGAHTIGISKPAGDNQTVQLRIDGVNDISMNSGYTNALADWNYIGGQPGQGSSAMQMVYAFTFDIAITAADEARILASLGANNLCCLLNAPPTSVSADLALSYVISATISADLALAYSVLAVGSISADFNLAYGITAAVSNSLTLAYLVAAATGSVTTQVCMNNTHTPWTTEAVVWTWTPAGRFGATTGMTVATVGAGNLVAGALTVSGLTLGAGELRVAILGATPQDDDIYVEYLTAA